MLGGIKGLDQAKAVQCYNHQSKSGGHALCLPGVFLASETWDLGTAGERCFHQTHVTQCYVTQRQRPCSQNGCMALKQSTWEQLQKMELQERDDVRKRTRQEQLDAMRFNTFKSQLEREKHAIAIK